MVRLSNLQTAGLCRELALLLHAGVSVGDGLSLLAQEESAAALRPVLENMAHYTDEGGSLAGAMREAACFPGYVCGLVEVGERSGRTEKHSRLWPDIMTAGSRWIAGFGRHCCIRRC